MVAQRWTCATCGFAVVSTFPPDTCPKCGAGASAFATAAAYRFPPDELEKVRRACWGVSYGLYLVSSIDGDRMNGQICNTLFQITSDPPRFAIGINHDNLTHEFIEKSGVFAATILGRNDMRIVRRFGFRSGRDFDKFKGVPVVVRRTGCPVYEKGIGYIECEVLADKTVDAGTHSIFIGDIVGGEIFRDDEPMTYAWYAANKDA
ncbi:MAG: flavin reductase [Candidatus Krumholzibacteriota bacterium]|nr:flavin reductase [Candidatus Krumholzibacteriota bacterium]